MENVVIEKEKVEDDDKEYDKQEIIKQEPVEGTKVSKLDKVILYIPDIVDEYPNFVEEEWSLEEIKNFCDEFGIIVTFTAKPTNEYPENTIISQSRAAGTTIVKGANLTIVYAVKYEETQTDKTDKTDDKSTDSQKENKTDGN